ncbi:hypothetical protein R3P38DRAFT_3628723 [Favolaschia claudopus]|uniref:HECT domain-containing protein n=1 Tax=Favolaschia claudopus TaxID=2862362 RepID=A0AAV9ZY63_9AGAR
MAATFGDMVARFVREAIASGNLSAIIPSTPTSTSTAPLPTLPVPPAAPYTSTRSLALPAAATGHPIPSNIPATVPAQPMLGVAGLALPLASGHTNNPRRTRVSDVLTAEQISQTNAGRMAAARAHLGSGSEEQLVRRGRRRRGPAAHPPVLHAGPQTVLDKVSSVSVVGERQIRVTHVVQPYQEGLEVIQYKNYREAHFHYLSGGDLTMDYDLLDTTRVSDILQMSARNMTVGPRQITFGRLSAGPSTRLQHEMLDLQVLVYVNNAKNRRNGTAHLRREALSANLTLADLFVAPLKAQYALPTHCVHNGRFLLHSIIRSPGATFIEALPGSLPRQHRCLTLRHNKQFNEAVEMNWDSSDDEGSTSGGVSAPEFDDEDIENFVPSAPALTAVTRPTRTLPLASIGDQGVAVAGEASMDIGGEQEMVPDSTRNNQVSSSSSTPAGSTAVMPPTQRVIVSTTTLPSQPVTGAPAITPPWPTSSWLPAPATLYRELHERNDVTAAIYQAATDGGTLELRGGSIDELAEAYIASVREAAARRDFSPLLRVRRRFQIVGPDGEISSFGSGIEAETIHKALDRFLSESARYCTVVDEDRLSLGISVPMSMRFGVTSARLDDLRVFGAMLSLSLICGHGIGDISPALIQYCLNQCNLESLTPSVISSWHPSLDRAARQLQAVGFGGNLTPFQDRIVGTLGIQLPALVDRDQNMHNLLVRQVIHTGAIGPEIHGHVETVPFAEGVELPCSNGFSFGKFARSFPGGTEFFLAHHWTSYISDFASLEPHMLITAPSPSALVSQFGARGVAFDLEFEILLTQFLRESGNPCDPQVFEDAKPHFHPDVLNQLSNIDSPSFRPRMFSWAATGSPFLGPDAANTDPIHVDFVLPDDRNYSDSAIHSIFHMKQGTISFRTCARSARIPVSYLVELFETTPPGSRGEAVNSWLMLQILNGIGKVSML